MSSHVDLKVLHAAEGCSGTLQLPVVGSVHPSAAFMGKMGNKRLHPGFRNLQVTFPSCGGSTQPPLTVSLQVCKSGFIKVPPLLFCVTQPLRSNAHKFFSVMSVINSVV